MKSAQVDTSAASDGGLGLGFAGGGASRGQQYMDAVRARVIPAFPSVVCEPSDNQILLAVRPPVPVMGDDWSLAQCFQHVCTHWRKHVTITTGQPCFDYLNAKSTSVTTSTQTIWSFIEAMLSLEEASRVQLPVWLRFRQSSWDRKSGSSQKMRAGYAFSTDKLLDSRNRGWSRREFGAVDDSVVVSSQELLVFRQAYDRFYAEWMYGSDTDISSMFRRHFPGKTYSHMFYAARSSQEKLSRELKES